MKRFKIIFIISLCTLHFALLTYLPPVFADTTPAGCIITGTETANGLITTPDIARNLVNRSSVCIVDPRSAFAPFDIPTFDSLKTLYFDLAKPTNSVAKHTLDGHKTQDDIPITTGINHLYYISGNLNITSAVPSPSVSAVCSYSAAHPAGVIFVGGDLNIGPLAPSNQLAFGDDNSGLIFIVKGKVNIHKDITRIDAVIISEGANGYSICTAYDGTSCPDDTIPAEPLLINGSLISLNNSNPVKFRRELLDNSQPAEKINLQVKYLVLLRNLLSDTTQRWSEIAANAPVPSSAPNAAASNPAPPQPPPAAGSDGTTLITTPPCAGNRCDGCCHGDIYGYNGIDCNLNALICSSNAASYENRSSTCGPDNRDACLDGTRKTYYTGTSTGPICNQPTCPFPYSPNGNHDAVCGRSWTGTIEAGTPDAVTGTWDQPKACHNPTTLENYHNGNECTPSVACYFPKPIDCSAYENMCHGNITGYNGLDNDGTGCIPNRKTCPSNADTYANQGRICGTNPQTGAIDNHNACIDTNNNHRRIYYTGEASGTSCTRATCDFPYSPNGNEAQVCGVNTAGIVDNHTACLPATWQNATFTALKTYYPGNSCSPVGCTGFPPATVCPDSCHGPITGYNGRDCRNDHAICGANYTTYLNHPTIGSSICGDDNVNGCYDTNGDGVPDTQRSYASGASCSTGDGTCPYPYSPSGNHDAVCGRSWTGTIEAGTPDAVTGTWDQPKACHNPTTLENYHNGNECIPSVACYFPEPIDCSDYANMCHGNITGYTGLDNDGTGCIPNRKTCLSNAASYGDTTTASPVTGQKTTCGTSAGVVDNHLSCSSPNPNGLGLDSSSRRQYYTGSASGENCTFASCGFPPSTCTTSSADCPAASGATNCHGTNDTSYRCLDGTSCSRTGYCPATYLNNGTAISCTADGCSDPSGGTRNTGVLANSCSTYNCPLTPTYDSQCRVGGVSTGALICTPSDQTPPTYHTGGTTGSCTATSCGHNYLNNGTAISCTADGCSDPSGGTRNTGVLANSCSTYNCPLTPTYDSQCRVGGVSTGALICTPSDQTPPTYHTGGNTGSCTALSCGHNYLSVSNTPPACRDSAYPVAGADSCTYDTSTYPQNCFTRCNSANTGCLYKSTIIVGGAGGATGGYTNVDAYWRDWYRNPSTLAFVETINSTHWNIRVQVSEYRYEDWSGTECIDPGYGYYYDDFNVNNSIYSQRNIGNINRPRVTCPGPVTWYQSCGNEYHEAASSCDAGFSKDVLH